MAGLVDVSSAADRLSRDSILEAAVHLLEAEGCHAVTLRGVARRVQVTPPALYRYFGCSSDLLDAVAATLTSRLERDVDAQALLMTPGVVRLIGRSSLLMTSATTNSLLDVPSSNQIQQLLRDLRTAQAAGEIQPEVRVETVVVLLHLIIAGFTSSATASGREALNPIVVLSAFLEPYLAMA